MNTLVSMLMVVAAADKIPKEIEYPVKVMMEMQEAQIRFLEEEEVKFKKRRAKANKAERDEIDEYLRKVKNWKTNIKLGYVEPPRFTWQEFDVGRIGSIADAKYIRAVQILDKGSMLAAIVDRKGQQSPVFLLRNISTKNMADEDTMHIPPWLWVDGTESYGSVVGAKRTVYTVRLVDFEACLAHLRKK